MPTVPIEQLDDHIGQEIGASEWFAIDQARIDTFADVTLDHQYIHVDPTAAQATPWGTTIAHGFLTLSLLTYLTAEIGLIPEKTLIAINYGTDKVRFLEPVRVGSEIRARVVLKEVSLRGPGRLLLKSEVTIEIRGVEKPAMVAESLTLFVTEVPS